MDRLVDVVDMQRLGLASIPYPSVMSLIKHPPMKKHRVDRPALLGAESRRLGAELEAGRYRIEGKPAQNWNTTETNAPRNIPRREGAGVKENDALDAPGRLQHGTEPDGTAPVLCDQCDAGEIEFCHQRSQILNVIV